MVLEVGLRSTKLRPRKVLHSVKCFRTSNVFGAAVDGVTLREVFRAPVGAIPATPKSTVPLLAPLQKPSP